MAQGVWVRPFRSIVYLTPAFTIRPDELSHLTHAIRSRASLSAVNYIQQLRDPRRRLAVIAVVVVLHIIMIYGWFNLKLYGGAHWEPRLVHGCRSCATCRSSLPHEGGQTRTAELACRPARHRVYTARTPARVW